MAQSSFFVFGGAFGATVIATLLYLVVGFGRFKSARAFASIFAIIGFLALTISLTLRWIVSGRAPFANQYEFSVSFAWGIILAYLITERQYKSRSLGILVMPVATALMWYASTIPADIQPLVPALQNATLLTLHVAVAVIAYGTFAIGFGSAALFLVQTGRRIIWLPPQEVLDDIGYRSIIIGFPSMALVIILGAIWADIAWGSYWTWDPKETASLVTWLIYGAYLHARTVAGWRGSRSALLLILGFAATLFTFFSNLFLGGLHSYAGV